MLYPAAQQDTDSSGSSLNTSREDVSVAISSLHQSAKPPSFDSIFGGETHPTIPSPLCPSPTTPESPLSSSLSGSTISLPGYSGSLPVPDYRPNPTRDERRLEFVPTRSTYARTTGVWTKRIKDMMINMHNQDPIGIQRAPRYGRKGIVRGTIEFDEENLAMFEKVKLVIEGQASVGNNAYEARSETFVRKSFKLWRKLQNSSPCPQVINFQIPFAAIRSKWMEIEQLPPSYVCDLGQGGRISCSYSMYINVTQKSKYGFWTHCNRHVIPINYVPNRRTPHVFPTDLVFPRSIKAAPGDWRQIVTADGSMSCNLFIPSVSAFCVTDEIPFFLQLVAHAGHFDLKDGDEPTLQVSLQRQVGISIQETFIWKDTTSSQGVFKSLPIGNVTRSGLGTPTPEGVLSSNPLGESILTRGFKRNRSVKGTRGERVENGAMNTWEWKGTVSNVGIKVGGCSTDVLVINDLFAFSVSIKRSNGQVREYRYAQPIEMVSEAT